MISPTMTDPNYCKISDHLYLGGMLLLNKVSDLSIKVVLSVGEEFDIKKGGANQNLYSDETKNYLIPILDDESAHIENYFISAAELIETAIKNKQNVLVHCMQGVSRSPTIILAWLMIKRKMSYESAMEYLYNKRKGIRPNGGFVRKLQQLDEKLSTIK